MKKKTPSGIGNKKKRSFFLNDEPKNVRIARKNSRKLAKKEAGTIMYACTYTHALSYYSRTVLLLTHCLIKKKTFPFPFFKHGNESLDTCPNVLGANRIVLPSFASINGGLTPSVCLSPDSSAGVFVSNHWAPFGGAAATPPCW